MRGVREESDERLSLLARASVLFALAYAALYLALLDTSGAYARDGAGYVVGRDFLNFWMAGRAAWSADPGAFYNLAAYQAEIARIVGPNYHGQVWSYPPSIMLLAAPFVRLPYFVALGVWLAISAGLFLWALRAWSTDRRLAIAGLLAPAAVFGLISGQLMYAAAAIVLTALRLREARPYVAGALLGLLTLKPQLGLFFPVLLLATRNWRMIGAAALSALAIAATTAAIWGPQVWFRFLGEGMATQSRVLSDPEVLGARFMPTIFMNLRTIGVGVDAAFIVQGVAALVAAGLIWWVFARRPAPADHRANALFCACAVFGTPYLLSYDTLPLAVFALLAAPPGRTGRILQLLAFFLPLIQIAAGEVHLPGPALIPLALALYLVKQPASSTWVDQRNWPTGCTQSSR